MGNIIKMKFNVLYFLLLSSITFAQSTIDCEVIHCDCENISEADKKLGKEGLCKYLEKKLKIKCQKGANDLKCQEDAKGPNAWSTSSQIDKIIKNEKEDSPISSLKTYNSVEDILFEIKNAKDPIVKYLELHSSLNNFEGNRSGLALAMELSDLLITITNPTKKINFALYFASHPTEYSQASIDLFLPRLISGFSVIEELEIDQLDMKYDLGVIFQKLKANGYDLNKIFAKGAHYGDTKVLRFVEDCDASVATNYSRKELKDLRNVSSKIYLRKLNRLIPAANKKKLARPIELISEDVLEWNEHLIEASIDALQFTSVNIETQTWDKIKMSKLYLEYDKIRNDDIWNRKRYRESLDLIAKELPIVWDLMKAIYLKK